MDDCCKVILPESLPQTLEPFYLKVFLEYRYSELRNGDNDHIVKSLCADGHLELGRVAHSCHPSVHKADWKGRKLKRLALERI